MNHQKMLDIMAEVNARTAEREELIEYIAIALLAKKNLFILGDTGQAKSYCINEFRKRITGARQFERLISKQTDKEQLFGRIDLASIIPGNMPLDELMQDPSFAVLHAQLEKKYCAYEIDGRTETLQEAVELAKQLNAVRQMICSLRRSDPKMMTDGKIPDSDIIFLDELFKANDGILNSLLTALNERVYTNEGQTVRIPVISYFSASNEIPDFKDSTQAILKPLYDRFDLKLVTSYVEEKQNRMKILKQKQGNAPDRVTATMMLQELEDMQRAAAAIKVEDKINDLMDTVLCELRRSGIHVSDRRYFGFTPIVRAKAFLEGRDEVVSKDLLILKNYFWNHPEEIPLVEKILVDVCENPVGAEVEKYIGMADEIMGEMTEALAEDASNIKPYVKFSRELLRIYTDLVNLQKPDMSDGDKKEIETGKAKLEESSKIADDLAKTPHIPLAEKMRLNV